MASLRRDKLNSKLIGVWVGRWSKIGAFTTDQDATGCNVFSASWALEGPMWRLLWNSDLSNLNIEGLPLKIAVPRGWRTYWGFTRTEALFCQRLPPAIIDWAAFDSLDSSQAKFWPRQALIRMIQLKTIGWGNSSLNCLFGYGIWYKVCYQFAKLL